MTLSKNDTNTPKKDSQIPDRERKKFGVYTFNDEERNEIIASRMQITQGNYLTNDEANKEIEDWLG